MSVTGDLTRPVKTALTQISGPMPAGSPVVIAMLEDILKPRTKSKRLWLSAGLCVSRKSAGVLVVRRLKAPEN